MTLRDLRLRVRALVAQRRVERELDEELAFHLERETQKHVEAGVDPVEARRRAHRRFGSMALAAEGCRDARGVAWIDTCVRDIAYALRAFRRTPAVAATIVGTIGLGLGLVAAVFTIFNAFVFRVDAVTDADRLFTVERTGGRRLTLNDYDRLPDGTDIFSSVSARLADITIRIEGRITEAHLVTANFFEVVGVGAARGRTLTGQDESRPVLVVSHIGWVETFDRDPEIVGRRVLVNGAPFEIVGVTPEGFRGLSVLAPTYWAPISQHGQFRRRPEGRPGNTVVEIIGRLRPGMSPRTAQAGLAVWASGGVPLADASRDAGITLQPRGTAMALSPEVLLGFSPLFFAFGLVLMIGCANVANLLLARAVSRQREIGIRLSLGASRARLIRQLLTESLLLALVSALCALVLSRVVLDVGVRVLVRTMPPELGELLRLGAPATDWRVAAFLVVAAVVSTAIFGLAPALQATRGDLVRTVRGEIVRNARPGRERHALIVVQVTASALLLICAAVFLRSAARASTADPGIRTADTVFIDIVNEPLRTAMLAAVTTAPAVAEVSASRPDPLGRPREAFAAPAGAISRVPVSYRFVSPEYFSVLDIRPVRGRTYTTAEAAGAAVVVLSESTARRIWPDADAVGQVMRLEPDPSSETRSVDERPLPAQNFVVVGVVTDVTGFRMAGFDEAGVYVPITAADPGTGLVVRVHGDPDAARRALLDRLTPIDPSMGMVMTMRTISGLETYGLQAAFSLTLLLGGLALLLTLSGIFSVLSYLVEQRRKEIGVRIALGATAASVTGLVLSQSLRLVGIGLVAGGGLAWVLATLLMTTPAAARIAAIVHVFDPVAYVASLACIVAACTVAASFPALRAARIDPMATLRDE